MAIFGKKQSEGAGVPVLRNEVKAPAPPPAPAPAAGTAATGAKAEGSKLIVGPNIRLTGSEIADCDAVIVEGRVEATVDGKAMQIAETGNFSGNASVDMAEIRGRFEGELTVRRRLTVCGTGKVSGRVRYGALVVEEGGELSGDIDSLETPPAAAPTAPEPKIATPESKAAAPLPAAPRREPALPQGFAAPRPATGEGAGKPTLPPRGGGAAT